MTVVSYPGVYVEEIPGGARPIEVAGTSTAAFFGVAERGPIGQVKKIFSVTDFEREYGGFLKNFYLAHAVFQFFNNGGKECYIGRVAPGAQTASVTAKDRGSTAQNSLTISAKSPGIWGNKLQAVVNSTAAEDPENQFNLTIYQENPDPAGVAILLEAYENVSMNPNAPNFVEKAVNSVSQYIRASVNAANSNHIAGYSESADIDITATPFLGPTQRKFKINLHGDGNRLIDLSTVSGANLTTLEGIRAAMQTAIRALTPLHESVNAAVYTVTVSVENTTDANKKRLRITSGQSGNGSTVLVSDAEDANQNAAGALKLGKRHGGKEVFGSSPKRPQNNSPADPFYLLGDDTVAGAVSAVTLGSDGTLPPQDNDYIDAFSQLDKIRDVSLITVPGIGSTAVADAGMNYCRNRPLSDCFYIADMAQDDITLQDAIDYRDAINTPNTYGAVYFPWLKMLDPTGKSPDPILVPPAGYVAGMYAQIDGKRGVWKAPAGTEAVLGGAVGLAAELTDIQQGNLNKHTKSVCVIRKFPASGIVLWGGRTLSNDPEYKYISIRRTAIMIRKSIYDGIQWAVFEPNDHRLWSALRLNIGSFMNGLFRAGAFQGEKANDAYFVRCGLGDTMTQGDIDLGQVIVLVGFAPLKPAEFVIVRIQQKVGQQ